MLCFPYPKSVMILHGAVFGMLKSKKVYHFDYYFSFLCFYHHLHVMLKGFKPNSCQIVRNDDNSLAGNRHGIMYLCMCQCW